MGNDWLGETTDEAGKTDMERLERVAVTTLVTQGGCRADVAQRVVRSVINFLNQ